MTNELPRLPNFELNRGGPYHDLVVQFDRLGSEASRAPRLAFLLVAVAWGVPLMLSAIEGHAWGANVDRPFLLDPIAHARFLILVAFFTLAERLVDRQLKDIVNQFADAPLIAAQHLPEAAHCLAIALRQRDSALSDTICLALAAAITVFALFVPPPIEPAIWIVAPLPASSEVSFTLAGLWAAIVSNTLHWFLVFRWFKSIIIWSLLLRRISRLDLRLSATHPDGCGGLAFVGLYPNVFAVHIFAFSCGLGATIWWLLANGEFSNVNYGVVMGGWLVIVFGLFLVPLAAFAAPLAAFKKRELAAASSLATDHGRAAERLILGENLSAPSDPSEPTDVPDPSKLHAAARKLSTLPFARETLLPIGAAALLPLVVAGAAQWPVNEIWNIARKLLHL